MTTATVWATLGRPHTRIRVESSHAGRAENAVRILPVADLDLSDEMTFLRQQ